MLPRDKKNWVNWKLESINGKLTKIPYQPNGYKANSANSKTWSTYQEVNEASENFSGIGIVFDGSMMGVDLDHVLKANKIQDAASKEFVKEAKSYTEISPSGDGLHVIFALSEPVELEANSHKPSPQYKYECYTEKRYFTVTENIFAKNSDVRTIDSEEAIRLLKILGYPWEKLDDSPVSPMQDVGLPEDKILKVMFQASNGVKAKSLYDGDISAYNDDESAADMALCNMLAFYSGRNPDVMERLWLASPLGQRDKTQKRKDYRTRTIAAAIKHTKEVFTADRTYDNVEDFITEKKGKGKVILLCTENIQKFLESYERFSGRFRYDNFKKYIEYKRLDKWEQLRDIDVIKIQAEVSELHPAFGRVSKQMVADAIASNAERHSFDSAKEYFVNLIWDKTPRIDSWISKVYSTPDDAYHTAVGSNWIKGIAKRVMQPGCKFDYVLVLESPQGSKKTTSLSVLGGDWHVETIMTPDNKDFFQEMFGNIIVEFSEGETLSRADVKKLKAIITRQHDDIRLPYERNVQRHDRRCVFAMTTNEEKYLKDETGNRRWLPVKVGDTIDIEYLKNNRDQLFAEAYHRAIVLDEPTWEFPKEETEEMQRSRLVTDPKAEQIEEWYLGLDEFKRNEGITTRETFLGITPNATTSFGKEMGKIDEMQIGSILKNVIHLERRMRMIGGVRRYAYYPTEKTPKLDKAEMPLTIDLPTEL